MNPEQQRSSGQPVAAPQSAPESAPAEPIADAAGGNAVFSQAVARHSAARTSGIGALPPFLPGPGAARVARAIGNAAFSQAVARQAAAPASGIGAGGTVTSEVAAAIDGSRGSGQPLDEPTRERIAPALGDDLADVRVHTGPDADGLARSVSAEAFATGSDVYFSEGAYHPGSGDGQRLLAHELAHVVQQRGAPTGGELRVSEPGDALEVEADRVADMVLQRSAGTPAPLEIAQTTTPAEREQGLRGASSVPGDGMGFDVSGRDAQFTMNGVDMPLDLVSVDGGGTVQEVAPMFPEGGHQLSRPASQALELKHGRASELGIEPGKPLGRPVVARQLPKVPNLSGGAILSHAGDALLANMKEMGKQLRAVSGEAADNISSTLQGPTTAAQTVQALAQGTTGVAPLVLPARLISPTDQDKLKTIVQFRIVNKYCERYLQLHPDVAAALNNPAGAATPVGPPAPGTPPTPPAPATPAGGASAPATQPSAASPAAGPDRPTGGPTADAVDKSILDAITQGVQQDVEAAWKKGRWPDGHEYIWAESGDAGKDAIGITGSIAFANLMAQTIDETPALSAENIKLIGDILPSPGRTTVRMILGGTLARGASFTHSFWDDLAINIPAPVQTENGPQSSVALNINTNWLWDDNQTVWDFVVSVDNAGMPVVEDRKSGTPDDSSLFGWGEGGTHQNIIPSATQGERDAAKAGAPAGGQPAGVNRMPANGDPVLARTPWEEDRMLQRALARSAKAAEPVVHQHTEGPRIQRQEPVTTTGGAILATVITALSTDTAAAISGAVQVAAGAAQVGTVLAQGANGVQTLTLPAGTISQADQGKLKQILQFRIINKYCERFLVAHPDMRPPAPGAGATGEPPAPPAPVTPPKGHPAPAPAPVAPAPAAAAGGTARPAGGPNAAAIDEEIMNAVKMQVQNDVNKAWQKKPAAGREYIWAESGDSTKDLVGITGAIAFSNLYAQAIKETPTLNADAQALGIKLTSPGELIVRQIVGGMLDRSGSWSNSWWDDLAVNIPVPVVTEDGPTGSAVLRISTDWLWDGGATTWDFAISVGDDGTPIIADAKSGTPDDSRFLGWGEGGNHSTVPVAGGAAVPTATPGAQGAAPVDK